MTNSTLPGGMLIARALKAEGVDVLFTLPGSHIAPVLDASPQVGIQVVMSRHEESAVLMAEGWALATGSPGVAAVTAGPGLANALPGLAEANAAGAPVVVIAGRTAIGKRDRGAVQDLDQLSAVAAVTKWRATCLSVERLQEYVAEAFRQASWGAPGVAYLEVPEDVLAASSAAEAGDGAGSRLPAVRPVPEPSGITRALEQLGQSERPLVVAGSGAFFSHAGKSLLRFAERSGVPVTTTSAARGLLDDSHPLCLGSLVHGGAALVSADLALVLGSRFNANLMYGRPPLFPDDMSIIQVDIQPEHLGGGRRPELALVGDVGGTLDALSGAWNMGTGRLEGWQQQTRDLVTASRGMWETESEVPTQWLHPGWLAREASHQMENLGGGTWVSDGGDSVIWGIAFSKAHQPGDNMLIGSAMGTLGVGLPFAIGAGLANPRRPLLLFTGDGAFGFSAMELHTAVNQHLGMVVVVVNNGVWRGPGTVPDKAGHDFDYAALARAAGAVGARAESPEEYRSALGAALVVARDGRPSLVDARADPAVVSNLLRGLDDMGLM